MMTKQQKGFTMVELIAVVVMLGILTVVVAPRFVRPSSFASYTARDQIVAAARLAQERAMYDHSGTCYRLLISGGEVSAQSNASGYNNFGPDQGWINGIILDGSVSVNAGVDVLVYFDGLGNALDASADCTGLPATTSISVVGDDNLGVCIYDTGYIQAQSC